MKKTIIAIAMASVALGAQAQCANCGHHAMMACGKEEKCCMDANTHLERAKATMEAIYTHYAADRNLLRENYPFIDDYKATYLAEEDKSEKANPYSFLWPFSGTLTATVSLYAATHDEAYVDALDNRVLPGLMHYYDKKRKPAAYASYINEAKKSDRFYDDNVWLGIDLTDAYVLTGKKQYLDMAEEIWKFIESGIDDKLGGGVYWCEQKKHSKNTCSNAPGSVLALKLYQATKDERYLRQGQALYEWTKTNLQDPADGIYWDNKNLKGKIQTWKFAYNTGQMLQSAVLQYNITGKKEYLDEAQRLAEACYKHFFNRETTDDKGVLKVLSAGNIWFSAVMLRGFEELYLVDKNPQYMEAFARNLNLAWEKMRDQETGLFSSDWLGVKHDKVKGLLTQGAMVEMYARVACMGK